MTNLCILKVGDGFREEEGLEGLAAALKTEGTIVWAHLQSPSEAEVSEIGSTLRLHPVALEDLEHQEDRPRLRQYDDLLSIVFSAVRSSKGTDGLVEFDPINVLVGRRFLVTVNDKPLPELDEARVRWRNSSSHLPADVGAPLYCLLDSFVDGYFPVIDQIADDVDTAEDNVVERHSPAALPSIFALKKSMLRFRRVASAGRDVVNALQRHDGFFSRDNDIYFQDVYDHIVRITDSVDTYRELLGNAMETYLSVSSNQLAQSSNRLNETMQTLTSWSIMIGCGALITGAFGMNVGGIPFAEHGHGFLRVALVIGGIMIALLGLFRRKKWV